MAEDRPPRGNPWTTLSTRTIYRNPWILVREDQVRRPDGALGIYGVVETHRAVGVLALTPDEQVYLVGQWRYALERWSWEIVEGGVRSEESELDAARRELREEAGLRARRWRPLGGEVHLSNSCSNERAFLFLATELEEVEPDPDGTEVLEVRKTPLEGCLRMVDSGEVQDALTVIGLLRLDRWRRGGPFPAAGHEGSD